MLVQAFRIRFHHVGSCILKCSICRWSREQTAGLQMHHCLGWKNVGRVGFFSKAFYSLPPMPRFFSVFSLNFSALSGSLTHHLLLLPLCLPHPLPLRAPVLLLLLCLSFSLLLSLTHCPRPSPLGASLCFPLSVAFFYFPTPASLEELLIRALNVMILKAQGDTLVPATQDPTRIK